MLSCVRCVQVYRRLFLATDPNDEVSGFNSLQLITAIVLEVTTLLVPQLAANVSCLVGSMHLPATGLLDPPD